jgi:hypothetical protein
VRRTEPHATLWRLQLMPISRGTCAWSSLVRRISSNSRDSALTAAAAASVGWTKRGVRFCCRPAGLPSISSAYWSGDQGSGRERGNRKDYLARQDGRRRQPSHPDFPTVRKRRARPDSDGVRGAAIVLSGRSSGEELNIRYVLEGSVQGSGNRVRVTTQLIDAETDGHLWSRRFDGDIDDLFALQDEVTSGISVALNSN